MTKSIYEHWRTPWEWICFSSPHLRGFSAVIGQTPWMERTHWRPNTLLKDDRSRHGYSLNWLRRDLSASLPITSRPLHLDRQRTHWQLNPPQKTWPNSSPDMLDSFVQGTDTPAILLPLARPTCPQWNSRYWRKIALHWCSTITLTFQTRLNTFNTRRMRWKWHENSFTYSEDSDNRRHWSFRDITDQPKERYKGADDKLRFCNAPNTIGKNGKL